jgi:hypothetical protein
MPTGYTAKLYEGAEQTPRDFILACARAFGATIMQRDEDPDVPPRPREASTHEAEQAAKYNAELAEVKAWTNDEADDAAAASYAKEFAAWQESQIRSQAIRTRYLGMLTKIERWTAPTSEHEGLKKFMVEQLRESIRFDCDDRPAPVGMTGHEFRAQRIKSLTHMATSYEKYAREEIERVDGANAWISALYQSLPED